MSLSVRVRFEVLKRDRFTCVYCGQHPPDVLLEVDHVIPRAAGGSDDPDNLVTACWDCNRGKSDRMLNEGVRAVGPLDIAAAEERVVQARAYAELLAELRKIEDDQVWTVTAEWAESFRARKTEDANGVRYEHRWSGERFPPEASIRRVLRRLPLDDVLDAVYVTASRFDHARDGADRYFFGVCWRKVDDLEGKGGR